MTMLLNDNDVIKRWDLWYDHKGDIGWRKVSDDWAGKRVKDLNMDTVFIRKENEEDTK